MSGRPCPVRWSPPGGPVGRAVARPAEALRIDEGLDEVDRVPVPALQVHRQPRRAGDRCDARWGTLTHGRIRNRMLLASSRMLARRARAPPDEAVAAAQVARRRTPRPQAIGRPPALDQVLQVLAHGLRITQVVMLLHQAVEHRLLARRRTWRISIVPSSARLVHSGA